MLVRLLLVSMLAAACTSAPGAAPVQPSPVGAQPVAAVPTPVIVYVTPAPTSTPIVTSTPKSKPTPKPTPKPKATPKPVTGTPWKSFVVWAPPAGQRLVDILKVGADGHLYTMADHGTVEASAQIRWLNTHPPEPCYADEHMAYFKTVRLLDKAFDLILVNNLGRASSLIDRAGAWIERATKVLKHVSC